MIRRYQSVWVVKQGHESYNIVKGFSGFDFFNFMDRNREDFRRPVIDKLKGLTQ